MRIKAINEELSICKVEDLTQVKFTDGFYFLGKTDEEISLVCSTASVPANATAREDGWRAFCLAEKLDFSLVGILSRISAILADNEIGIFAVSTYNTDYILTKAGNFTRALELLERNGYVIER